MRPKIPGGNKRERFSGKPSPGEISAKDGQKPGEMRAKVITFSVLILSAPVCYRVVHISYPFLYPLYPLLREKAMPAGSPLLVARYARLKPLNVPFRYAPLHCGFNAAPQPIRPALRADQKIDHTKKRRLCSNSASYIDSESFRG